MKKADGSLRRVARRPNYFVGFRITTPAIIDGLVDLQRRLVQALPHVEPSMIDPRTFHVTLCTLRLEDESDVEQATHVLHAHTARESQEGQNNTSPLFEFRGLQFFGKRDVLYLGLDGTTAHAHRLSELSESLHKAFESAGLASGRFRKPYAPHITIWKTSKGRPYLNSVNKQRRQGNLVQDELFEHLKDSIAANVFFGTEEPNSIELLSMAEMEANGYYRVRATTSLVDQWHLAAPHVDVDTLADSFDVMEVSIPGVISSTLPPAP